MFEAVARSASAVASALLKSPEALATLLAGGAAIAVAAAGFWANQSRQKVDHAVAILMERFRNDYIRNGRRIVYQLRDEGVDLRRTTLEPADYHDVVNLLAFYDFVAISYYANRIDRKTVRSLFARSVAEIYEHCAGLIDERRLLVRQPGQFEALERFARQFRRR